MVLVIFFGFYRGRLELVKSCTSGTDLVISCFLHITRCEWLSELYVNIYILSRKLIFIKFSNRIINQGPSVGFWFDFEIDKLKIFWKFGCWSNRIEPDQIWFSCLNRIFVIFTEFLRSFGQKVKTFWVSMPFDTFSNQIYYERILDFE